ncbi:MAG: translocation protein TolB, partial [Bacteroidota bacterium]|nr:translocation protein TolB [Bacteroidota bacterium]
MYFRNRVLFLLFTLSLIPISFSIAQQSRDNFGKNRVQFKEFNWRFFSTENFDIYFYDDGQVNARQAADFLEDEFDRITDLLGYAPYAKTKIFLYNSVTDLQQSNVGLNENNFTIGGQTNFVKLQVELAYPGTVTSFKDELLFKVSQILIRDMMFGGSLTDVLQNTYLMSLPKWFIDGAALYIAKGWSIEMDDHMRDLISRKKIRKMNKLTGTDADLAGQSVWNFISERYGKSNISNILNLTRIIRNEENSVSNTLGIPFRLFLSDWQNYYREMAEQV